MVELSEQADAVIGALLRADRAWQTPAELAGALGADLEDTTDCLAGLDADGWLVAWDAGDPDGPSVTLSARAAARLDARLVEHGPDEVPRWATRDQAEPPPARAIGVFRNVLAAALELVVDPQSSPEAAAEAAEAVEAAGAQPERNPVDPAPAAAPRPPRSPRWPRPTVLLGTGTTPWPGPARAEGARCPVCCGRPLAASAYCLGCDRWGLDHRLAEVAAAAAPAQPELPDARSADDPQGQTRRKAEARARRSKRSKRLAAEQAARRRRKPPGRRGVGG